MTEPAGYLLLENCRSITVGGEHFSNEWAHSGSMSTILRKEKTDVWEVKLFYQNEKKQTNPKDVQEQFC